VTSRATNRNKRAARKAAAGRKPSKKGGAAKKSAGLGADSLAPIKHLRSDEAKQVLLELIARHPQLRPEALEMALARIEEVDAKRLGSELSRRLLDLSLFDTVDNSRDGSYVPLWQSAQETLDGLLEPYLLDLQRRIELGLKEAAQATALGIVLGLYGARDGGSDDSLLAHAPDFCEDEAHYVAALLAKQSGRLYRRRWPLPDGSKALLPDWPWLFAARGSQRRRRP
jgi:hypothetical protein